MIHFAVQLPADLIAGGIRTIYRHVEWLNEAGIPACVVNPHGHPSWFRSPVPVLTEAPAGLTPRDHVVFPEGIDDRVRALLDSPARKHVFCQNQYYVFRKHKAIMRRAELGIEHVYASSVAIAGFLRTTFGIDAPVIPYAIPPGCFRDEPKHLQIAYMPRKLAQDAEFIRGAFQAKFPQLASVPWVAIDGMGEAETMAELARSAVFLSLSHRESFGLPPVEAMACGCAVVGFHGVGGLEYATTANGIWFEHDRMVDLVDALGAVVAGCERGAPFVTEMIAEGRATAGHYTVDRARRALIAYFRSVGAA
ncbi:MAG TPA: glycosyltransferase [Azospirillum sp.]|nr:glycosyltransferase [Azospirillum sp.]